MVRLISYTSLFILVLFCISCKHDKVDPIFGDYPTEVGKIMTAQCARSGCHNNISKNASAGLSLETWADMFKGGNNGPVVVPYRSDYSSLLFSVNTFSDLGPQLIPVMPFDKAHLSRNNVMLIRDWIAQGAPDNTGHVLFTENADRQKIYLTNQGCDVVGVFDRATGILMRYIDVGTQSGIESPHNVKISPDKKYWYVVFTAGTVIQRYNASDDSFAGSVSIGSGNWNTLTISNDGTKAFCVDWSANGKIAYVDLQTMTLNTIWSGSMLFQYPHGSAINGADDTLYVTGQTGNFIYKIPISDPGSVEQVSMQTGIAPTTTSSLDIHEILFTPDHSKYFITCQKTNELRVVNSKNDSVLKVINVGVYPVEIALSTTTNYLFVTCMEDTVFNPAGRGCVAIIDYVNNTLVKKIYTGYQPHGVAVDDLNKLVYVANRNVSPGGPAPHHTGSCSGKNGYVTYINLNTLTLVKNGINDKRTEVAVDPYSMAVR